jgi:hypothetical protein
MKLDNNVLAAIAIILIVISLLNIFMALNIVKSRQSAAASAAGRVSLCASFIPNITASRYHYMVQYDDFYYDVNITQDESKVVYSDDADFFDIEPSTGEINFTAGNEDVGVHNITITASELVCNTFNGPASIIFNISNKNDPPNLIALVFTNESSGGTNATYYFPITKPIELWEDVQYNVSVIAEDIDLIHGDKLSYWAIWFEYPVPPYIAIGGLFNLNINTGTALFKPLQQDIDNYTSEFIIYDESSETDYEYADIFVHNVNDPPVLENKTDLIGGLGAITVEWGDPFYYDVNATDEDGDTVYYYLDFLSCEKLNASDTNCTIFEIDEDTGEIDFTPPFADVGNYTVNYTATDGMAWEWYVGSFGVSLFENDPPNITDWQPREYNITISEGESQFFNISVTDDYGTPIAQWYKDGTLLASGSCSNGTSNYTFYASYKDSGIYNITVMVSDGQYVVSHEWRLIVLDVPLPPSPPGGPTRPGGPVITPCIENWRCTVWSACSRENIQIRICVDLSRCNTFENKPFGSRSCIYTPFPTCYDGIVNCHDGSCEILTDCGGPCPSCPTCSDSRRNCHMNGECEVEIDCGGPCPPCQVKPKLPQCGNQICEAGELYECMEDCAEFWLDTVIFVLIILLLILFSILLYVYKKETILLYVYRKVRGE